MISRDLPKADDLCNTFRFFQPITCEIGAAQTKSRFGLDWTQIQHHRHRHIACIPRLFFLHAIVLASHEILAEAKRTQDLLRQQAASYLSVTKGQSLGEVTFDIVRRWPR